MNFFQADAILQRLPVGDYVKEAEPTLLITSDQVNIYSWTCFRVSEMFNYVVVFVACVKFLNNASLIAKIYFISVVNVIWLFGGKFIFKPYIGE